MKQYLIATILLAMGLCWLQAAAEKKARKVLYEFPEAMAPAVRIEYAKQCDKGLILYNINCAKCHKLVINGEDCIPDFTPEQLVGYELRVLNPKHENDLPETAVNAEELGQIMTFLSYKKKNPLPVK